MVLSTRLRAVCLKLESWLGCLSRKTQLRKYPQLSKAFPCLEVNTLVPKPCLGGEPNAVGRQLVKLGELLSWWSPCLASVHEAMGSITPHKLRFRGHPGTW